MKQITFSNLVAVVAILLCLYAFAGEKTPSSNTEKEYCIMEIHSGLCQSILSFSDGRYDEVNLKVYSKESKDYSLLKYSTQKLNELSKGGWELKNATCEGSSLYVYFLEKNKD